MHHGPLGQARTNNSTYSCTKLHNTFQLDARKMTSAKNCWIRLDLWISSIPLLPFLMSGFVEPHNNDTKKSQNALPKKYIKNWYHWGKLQSAKRVVSDSLGLVDFALRLANSVLNSYWAHWLVWFCLCHCHVYDVVFCMRYQAVS